MQPRTWNVSLAVSLLVLAAGCGHAGRAAHRLATPTLEDGQAVAAVFSQAGAPPPTKAGPASPWEKKLEVPGQPGKLKVYLSYEDREIAEADGRIFEGFDPFKLPAGVYTYVVTSQGVTSFGRPVDAWEIGTRHAQVAQKRLVVAAGELHTDGHARIRINSLSGTYALPLIREGRWTPDELRRRTVRWFDEVLRRKHGAAPSFAVEEAVEGGRDAPIFDVTLQPPDLGAVRTLCAAAVFARNNGGLCTLVAEAKAALGRAGRASPVAAAREERHGSAGSRGLLAEESLDVHEHILWRLLAEQQVHVAVVR